MRTRHTETISSARNDLRLDMINICFIKTTQKEHRSIGLCSFFAVRFVLFTIVENSQELQRDIAMAFYDRGGAWIEIVSHIG